jgi:hypothetical protein
MSSRTLVGQDPGHNVSPGYCGDSCWVRRSVRLLLAEDI